MDADKTKSQKTRVRKSQVLRKSSGQSLVEFAFLLPLVLSLFYILIQVEMAISTAIVNQKYARQHLHFLTFNHRYYIQHLRFLGLSAGNAYMQRYWIGVDNNVTHDVEGDIRPVAPTRKIGREKPPQDDIAGSDVTARQNVRVRITAFTCLPPIGINFREPFTEDHLGEETFAGGRYRYCQDR
ncbi:MAG: TadE family protein [Bdellovibrionota bacterium]